MSTCEARALKEALSEGVVRKEEVSKGLHLKGSVQFEHKLSNSEVSRMDLIPVVGAFRRVNSLRSCVVGDVVSEVGVAEHPSKSVPK